MEKIEYKPEQIERKRRALTIGLTTVIGLVALTGCSDEEPSPPPEGPVSTYIDEATERLNCILEGDPNADCDADGYINSVDLAPGRDDAGDDDGDYVSNAWDRWPGLNDTTMDSDSDGTPDYLDSFFGDNYGDIDADGWMNFIDPQPYAAPTQPILPPSQATTLTNEELAEQLMELQIKRKMYQEIYGPDEDRDYDGWPDDTDPTPTEYTNDRDGDGDSDYYDPEPGNGFIDSKNDPYDPRNDEYWED